MKQRIIYLFIGTTAELIKLVPVIREFKKRKITFTIIATGQNDIRFEEYARIIKGVRILKAVTPKSKDSSVWSFFIWAVRTFFSLLLGMRSNFKGLNKSNSYFIIHGDTVSSLMGSLVASLYGLKLVHIESGLRSFHFFEPFPEEISRYIVSRLADIHFCPNEWSVKNLSSYKGDKVNTHQNTLIEAFYNAMEQKIKNNQIHKLIRKKRKYFVMVIHRQEHVSFGSKSMYPILSHIFAQIPENLDCIFLLHDQSRNFINMFQMIIPKEKIKRIIRIGRLPYTDFMHLLHKSEFMITDGGSNQEEMYYMGKPCLLIRKYTERIEGLKENVILSKNSKEITSSFISNYKFFVRKPIRIKKAPSKIIVDYLLSYDEISG